MSKVRLLKLRQSWDLHLGLSEAECMQGHRKDRKGKGRGVGEYTGGQGYSVDRRRDA